MSIDFRAYHYRAMNAKSEQEKAEINQELKDLYEQLSEDEKKDFNENLQKFLISEFSKISSMARSLRDEEE